jgi:NDP-sugar pyrophosphorylase family protein
MPIKVKNGKSINRAMAIKKTAALQRLKAVILVGGMGTRLRPLTDICPKPIVPVLNYPFLEHSLAHLKQFGIVDVILAMSYLPDAIPEYFEDGERFGMRLTYCIEKEPLGTAGAVKNAAAYLDSPFIVFNGDDVFIEMDLHEAFTFYCEKRAKATIFLTRVEDPSAFGVVETDKNQKVQRFIEKPPPGTTMTNWINAGGYILDPEVLEYIPSGQHYMFENGLFPSLLSMQAPVYGYHYKGYWMDMGTPEKYYSLNMDLLQSKVHSPLIRESRREEGIYCSPDITIHPSAVITAPAIIGGGCRIGKEVHITGPATIGRDCILEDGTRLENAILWDGVRVGAGARLNRCIVSSNAIIGMNQDVNGCVVTPLQTVSLFRR